MYRFLTIKTGKGHCWPDFDADKLTERVRNDPEECVQDGKHPSLVMNEIFTVESLFKECLACALGVTTKHDIHCDIQLLWTNKL